MEGRLIGSGSHSKVILGSYFMTPVAIKQFQDQEAFTREYNFYKKSAIFNHPNLLTVLGVY